MTVINNTGLSFIQGMWRNLHKGQFVPFSFNGVVYNFVATYYGGTGNDLVLQWANNRLVAWRATAAASWATATPPKVRSPWFP